MQIRQFKQEVVGSNPTQVACESFFTSTAEYAVLYTRQCRATLNQLFTTQRKN